jgi:hypothetical protein
MSDPEDPKLEIATLKKKIADLNDDLASAAEELAEEEEQHEVEVHELESELYELRNGDPVRQIIERSWLLDARATENDLIRADLAHLIGELRTDHQVGRLKGVA